VQAACTTDDPCDDLSQHRRVNTSDTEFRIYPTFRPDKAFEIDDPEKFNAWVSRLEESSNVHINSLPAFLDALRKRHDAFHTEGGRMSDHALTHCYSQPCSEGEAAVIFNVARSGKPVTNIQQEQYAAF
jgi:glucuronate isomerase